MLMFIAVLIIMLIALRWGERINAVTHLIILIKSLIFYSG